MLVTLDYFNSTGYGDTNISKLYQQLHVTNNIYSSCRLNAQHYTWQRELQFLLHPDIPPPQEGSKIADIATGTGAWLLELAEAHPTIQCDGFDINLTQCPPKHCLPSNLTFNTWDIFTDPPLELSGKYDIVHIRLIILVIQNAVIKTPVLILQNLAKLLKPGGYLQWEELDLTHTIILPSSPDNPQKTKALHKMDSMMKNTSGYKWIRELPNLINENGFEETKDYQFRPKKELMRFNTDTTLLSWVELANSVGDGERKELFRGLVEEVLGEVAEGGCHAVAKGVFVARRRG